MAGWLSATTRSSNPASSPTLACPPASGSSCLAISKTSFTPGRVVAVRAAPPCLCASPHSTVTQANLVISRLAFQGHSMPKGYGALHAAAVSLFFILEGCVCQEPVILPVVLGCNHRFDLP